jgi:cytochrome c553
VKHFTYLETLTFGEFIVLLHAEFLSLEWEDNALSVIHHQQGTLPFDQWVALLHHSNALLKDTGQSLSNSCIKEQIRGAMNEELKARYQERKDILGLESIPVLERWLSCMSMMAEEVETVGKNQTKTIIDAAIQAIHEYLQQQPPPSPRSQPLALHLSHHPHPSLASHLSNGLQPPLISRLSNPPAPPPQTMTAAPLLQHMSPAVPPVTLTSNRMRTYPRTLIPPNFPQPPPLNPDTHKDCIAILACFKCHQPYADHVADNCPLENLHQRYWEHNYSGAELEILRRDFMNCQGIPEEPVEPVNSLNIAAFMGGVATEKKEVPSSSGVLEDNVEGNADKYISTPLSSHFWWTCQVDSVANDASLVQALIDHGSLIVLISNDLTTHLKLCPLPL